MSLSRRFIALIVLLSLLCGCRYWSMVRFAHQFCDYDAHIAVTELQDRVHLSFHDPVLPEPVFMRYFKAAPFLIDNRHAPLRRHHYRVAGTADDSPSFEVIAEFTDIPGTAYLAGGQLDPQLSAVFGAKFADAVLRAACSEAPEFGLQEVSVPMTLAMPVQTLPSRADIIRLFSRIKPAPSIHADALQLRLDFVTAGSGTTERQERPIDLHFGFHNNVWQTLSIHYDQYSLWLDFGAQRGLLHVIRR